MVRLGRAIRARWIERSGAQRSTGAGPRRSRATTVDAVPFGPRVRAAMRAMRQAFFADDEQRAAAVWDFAAGGCIVIAVVVATW